MKNGIDKPLNYQLELLEEILMKNKTLKTILEKLETLKLENYYVAAGAINQTVFDYLHGYDPEHEINNYDIVYFDEDTSYEKEDTIIKKIMNEMGPINAKLDIKNQARVHLWYEKSFGHKVDANLSVEDAINKWPSTVTSIGVRMEKGKLVVYAPYGLNDLFNMIIRPVKRNFTKEQYGKNTKKWKRKWPNLTIISWD